MGYYQQVENEKKKALYGAGGTKDNPKGDSYYAVMKAKQAVNVDQTKVNLNYLGNNKWSGDSQVKYSTIEDHPANESEIFKKKGQKTKDKLYLVAYKGGDSTSYNIRGRGSKGWNHQPVYGVTKNKPNWQNSNNGIYMEIDVKRPENNFNSWKDLVSRHLYSRRLKSTTRFLPDSHWASGIEMNVNNIVKSGHRFSKAGGRGSKEYGSIKNLDTNETGLLWSGAHTHQNTVHDINSTDSRYRKGSRNSFAGKTQIQNIHADIDNKYAPEENEIIDKLSETNREANKKNEAKNKAYERIKLIASQTQGSDYLTRRNSILDSKGNNPSDPNGQTIEQILKAGGFNDDEVKNITIGLKDSYKNFYKTDKISNKWTGATAIGDGSSLYDFKMKEFDSKYYGTKESTGQQTSTKWDNAKNSTFLGTKDEDIDITEVYGNKDTYLKYDFSEQIKSPTSSVRGSAKQDTDLANTYQEYTKDLVTDEEIQFYRDKQLGIQDADEEDTTVARLLAIDEVGNSFDQAKNQDSEEYQYWQDLGKEYLLDPTDQDEFVTLYKLSDKEEHKNVVMEEFVDDEEYDPNNPDGTPLKGLSELESAVTRATGEDTALNVKRLGVLTKNVLRDTINEIQKAKQKEQFLDFMGGLDGFSEVMDMGETMKNSILGDTGIGGMKPFISGVGRMEESLEKGIQGLSGMQNNIQYNWQNWFDNQLTDKYGKDYKKFMPLETQKNIARAFTNPDIQQPVYNKETKEFNKDFLEKAGFENTKQLEEFLTNEEHFTPYNPWTRERLDAHNEEDATYTGGSDGLHLLAELKGIEVDPEKGSEWKALGYESKNEFYKDIKNKAAADVEARKNDPHALTEWNKLQHKVYELKIQGYDVSATNDYSGPGHEVNKYLDSEQLMKDWIPHMEERIDMLKEETGDDEALLLYDLDGDGNRIPSGLEDDPDTEDVDESFMSRRIENDFARNFINNYLEPRFNQSKSMNEFVEYLDVRAEEQNPFQTQTSLNAVQAVARNKANEWKDKITEQRDAQGGGFDFNYYLDPTSVIENYEDSTGKVAELNLATNAMAFTQSAQAKDQKEIIAKHWEDAKDQTKGDQVIGNGIDLTWNQLFYKYGTDREAIKDAETFAKIHYEAIGSNPLLKNNDGKDIGQFDPRGDLLHTVKVKNAIYGEGGILDDLSKESKKYDQVFGTFITPEEFADDVIGAINPEETPEAWNDALDKLGMSDFKGGVDELKTMIKESIQGGSAMDIRQGIKYLQEENKAPTQERLGITYIQREEDDINKNKGEEGSTELFKMWQKGGYQGSEEEFYSDFMTDTSKEEQEMLTKAMGGGFSMPEIDLSDPFAAMASVESIGGGFDSEEDKEETETDDASEHSFFNVGIEDKNKNKKDEDTFDFGKGLIW